MLTVDFTRFPIAAGDRVLDLGAGAGRHAFECYRRGARVVALDLNGGELAGVAGMFRAMAAERASQRGTSEERSAAERAELAERASGSGAGEAPEPGQALAVRASAYRLPFADGTFDAVIAAEILEHLPDDATAIAEASRVLRPGGRLAVTVPRWWPERICWALSRAYHEVEGGHVRIYRGHELLDRLTAAGLAPTGRHHAHALHSPYWWVKCLFGPENDRVLPVRLYHRLLVHDIMRGPWWTRRTEQALNPVLGKSLVLYLVKPA